MLVTLLVALFASGLGRLAFGRWTVNQDPATRWGVHGLLGLAILGWITLPIGLLPSGFKWGVGIIGLLALTGLFGLVKERPSFELPKGPSALALLVLVLGGAIALVGVLAPSDSYDWDSLAYHLAVPKLWLEAGQITFVSFIHHSNFPGGVDGLFVWGQLWGGEAGAKMFTWAYTAYGTLSVFGIARQRYGNSAGWWSAIAFATVPVVLWESGTAYIDVAHSLFGGLGIWFAAELLRSKDEESNANWVLPALFLGGAVGTKYTGLQTVPLVGAVMLGYAFLQKAVRPMDVVKMGLVAMAIGSPWYVKNVVTTGNPVYPFFYSVFGGKNWDAFSESIYRNQQQGFGAGREMSPAYTEGKLQPSRIGSSILGLAYMPGRYSDPGPTSGMGFPFVSLGAIPLVALLAWLLSGKPPRRESACLIVAMLGFAAWFVLSQQARYVLVAGVPLLIMAGGAVSRLKAGQAIAGAIAVQALGTFFVQTRYDDRFSAKLRVVLGTEPREAYQDRMIGFSAPARYLNTVAKGGRVALYDEVFGYMLDVPYFWATPGHTTEMGYATMQTADELVAALKKEGITYVYFSMGTSFNRDKGLMERWMSAAGLNGPVVPYAGEERAKLAADRQASCKLFLAEAVAAGKLRAVTTDGGQLPFGTRLIFEVL